MKKYVAGVLAIICLVSINIVGCSNSSLFHQKFSRKEQVKLLEKIKKRGKLLVATEAALPPFEFVENGEIIGYGADILHEVVKAMGVELEQLDIPFSGILISLDAKKFDFVATSLSVSPERKEKYGLTSPIGEFSYVFVKNKINISINNKEDLTGKTIGFTTGSAVEKYLNNYNEQLALEGKEKLIMKAYNSMPEVFMDLQNGRIDTVLTSKISANRLMKMTPDTYEVFEDNVIHNYISWGVRKEDEDLLIFLNNEILKLKKSGKLNELQEKWFGATWDLPDQLP